VRTLLVAHSYSFDDQGLVDDRCRHNGSRGVLAGVRQELAGHGWEIRLNPEPIVDAAAYDCVVLDNLPKRHAPALDAYRRQGALRRMGLLAFEPATFRAANWDPAIQREFGFVLGWDTAVTGSNYHLARTPYTTGMTPCEPVPFAERKLCALIACNKFSDDPSELYSARRAAARFFEANHPAEFDLYGWRWETDAYANPFFRRSRNLAQCATKLGFGKPYPSWRGTVDDKFATLGQYRFSICFENGRFPGYITEKLFDSLNAMCVPVYLGAPDVADCVPRDVFIDRRDFATDEELYAYLAGMSETRYAEYTAAISAFLASSAYQAFSGQAYARALLAAIEASALDAASPPSA